MKFLLKSQKQEKKIVKKFQVFPCINFIFPRIPWERFLFLCAALKKNTKNIILGAMETKTALEEENIEEGQRDLGGNFKIFGLLLP